MILNIDAKTNIPDLVIDFIEVKLQDGRELSLSWDESEYTNDAEEGDSGSAEYGATYKGISYCDDEGEEIHLDGRIEELEGLEIITVGLYSDNEESDGNKFEITKMEIIDGDYKNTLVFTNPYKPEELYFTS